MEHNVGMIDVLMRESICRRFRIVRWRRRPPSSLAFVLDDGSPAFVKNHLRCLWHRTWRNVAIAADRQLVMSIDGRPAPC
jgi:hypothetical protein